MARANERGSVVGFVVVGVLLAALVVGGVFVVKTKLDGNLASKGSEQTSEQLAANTEDKKTEQKSEAEQKPSSESEKSQPDTSAPAEPQSNPEQAPAETPQPAAPGAGQQPSSSPSTPLPTTGVEVDRLPQTGSVDVIAGLVGVSALVGAVVAYRRSAQL